MRELRKDPIIDRWVIISSERGKRPAFFFQREETRREGTCPLCPGNERMTPPEVFAVREQGSPANGPGWRLRVVPNKFPALRIEGELNKEGVGLYDKMNGIGAHEIVVETPVHGRTMAEMEVGEVQAVMAAYRARILDLFRDRRFKYVVVFKNHGAQAGATLDHSHSQLIALPIVPRRVQEEIQGSLRYFQFKDRCVFCDIIDQEMDSKERVVAENEDFVAICPFASRFPFEMWIIPKTHEAYFELHADGTYHSLSFMLKTVLERLDRGLSAPPYNFMIHTAPLGDHQPPYYHWHIEIIPRLTRMAGFEWGTGFYINPTPPEEAAAFLKEMAGQ
jgi:UDPglucose--hexose-1-phosphate uridylyltransferase